MVRGGVTKDEELKMLVETGFQSLRSLFVFLAKYVGVFYFLFILAFGFQTIDVCKTYWM